jgi:BirA family biotin operon repressor/biotin-[acetyl-CoA-carboxylase] ligase
VLPGPGPVEREPADDDRPADDPAVPGWVIALPTCPSTNTWALDRLDALAHGACVWTRRQTHGRGRGGAPWYAPPGVLTASFVLDLGGADERSVAPTRLSLAAGLAVAHAVEDVLGGERVAIKWPNDCYLRDRKLAGLLCETRARTDGGLAVVIGVGLNLAPRWEMDARALPLAAGKAAPIGLDELGEAPAMTTMLVSLRRYLLEACGLLAAGGWGRLLGPLRQRDWLNGRSVLIQTGAGAAAGRACGIGDDGALLVDDGERVVALASGTVAEAH